MKVHILAALPLLAALACSKPPEPFKETRSAFQLSAERVGAEPPCARIIPGEWSPSLPVPALKDGRLAYRVFFFAWSGRPGENIVYSDAGGDALFTPEGRVLACARRPGTAKRLPEEAPPRDAAARAAALHPAIEEMGRLYARGGPVPAEDRKRVAEFSREFAELAGSGHAPAYRALEPGFWAWVESNGGRAP